MNPILLTSICLLVWIFLRPSLVVLAPSFYWIVDIIVGVLCLPSIFYIVSVLLLTSGLHGSSSNQRICYQAGLVLTRLAAALDVVNKLIPGNPFASGSGDRQVLIASFLHAMEKSDAASKHAKRFIKNYKKDDGFASNDNLSKCLMILAEIEMQKGNYAEGKKFADQSVSLIENSPNNALSKGAALTNLCTSYMKMGLIEESIRSGNKAVDSFDPSNPLHNQLQAIAYNNLGLAYSYAGNYAEAYNCAKRSFNLKKAAYSVANVSHVISHVNLSESLLFLDRYEEALTEAKEAIRILDELGFADDLKRATALQNVGAALVGLGRLDEAKAELESALKGKKKHMPSKDPEWYSMYLDLAKLHAALKEQGPADKYFVDSMNIVKTQLGEKHPRAAYVALEYSKFLEQSNRAKEAADYRAQADSIKNQWSTVK